MSLASIPSRLVRKILLEFTSSRLRSLGTDEDASGLHDFALRISRDIAPFGRVRRFRTRSGIVVLGDMHDVITRLLFITGEWEPGVTSVIQQVLRPGGVMIDIGANVGYHALCGAACVGPDGLVVAFEPAPRTADSLRANLALNPGLNVEIRSEAVCDFNGEVEFFAVEEGHTGLSGILPPNHSSKRIRVPAVRFDDAWKDGRHIDLIKIDVEIQV